MGPLLTFFNQFFDLFVGFLQNFFSNPSLLGWSLAILSGVIWLACYRPPFISKPWLWVILAGGAVAAPIAIVITSFPVGFGVSRLLSSLLSQQSVQSWGWLLSIPSIFIFGLVWEGAKLVPVTIYWWRKKMDIDPKFGLLIGAVAGAGFGIMLAQWTNNFFISDSKLSWALVQAQGFKAISGFWESFFVLGLNVASTALAGWGLAKGWGWKFYLLACSIYLVTNYNTVLVSYGLVTATQAQFIIAAWALIAVGVTLWLRERKPKTLPKKSGTTRGKSRASRKK
jgi:RsiW-degrading membrane proteinase PrsW (M82 family)